jgi:hypothetical protein
VQLSSAGIIATLRPHVRDEFTISYVSNYVFQFAPKNPKLEMRRLFALIRNVFSRRMPATSSERKMLYPKEFIQNIYIENVGQILDQEFHYITFGLLGTGIEFLGKCINEGDNPTWHTPRIGKRNFDKVLIDLMPRYATFKDSHKLCDSLRNGMAHAFQPKGQIELTHKKEAEKRGWIDLQINSEGRLVLVVEDLYRDFKTACLEVLQRIDDGAFDRTINNKMYEPFLEV